MSKKDWAVAILINVFNLTMAFTAGWLVHAKNNPPELTLPVLSEARELIENNYLFDIPSDKQMEYGMISGMLQSLNDPYARFASPPEHEIDSQRLEGSFGGIGSTLDRDADNNFILFPYPDSPARAAGIEDGDRLYKVDGVEIFPDTPINDLIAAIRGPEGEDVLITVIRQPGDQELEFSVERANIATPTVTWRLAQEDDRIGIFKVNWIASSTPDEIERAVADLKDQGATHFVMDLRGNGGGLLVPGVDIARLFLEDGVVIYEQYRNQAQKSYEVDEPGSLSDIPLVILIDSNTASAAEIIAGALQAQGRAILMGTHSYGKDTVQLIFGLEDGSSIHITGGKWWTENGSFDEEDARLIPDIPIDPSDERFNPTIEEAIIYFFGE